MTDKETYDDYLEEVWSLFAEDGKEALDLVEETLLELESDPTDAGQVAKLFRAMHTFKGEARMMGLSVIESLAHHAEDLVALIRDEGVALTDAMVDLLLEVLDQSRVMLDHALAHRRDADTIQVEELVARLKVMLAEHSGQMLLSQKGSSEDVDESTTDDSADEMFVLTAVEEIIDPATDPEYVQIFLEMAKDEMGRLRTAMDALADGDEEGIQQVKAVVDSLTHAAERMGYEHLVGVLDDLAATVETLEGEKQIDSLNELERVLSEGLATIQSEDVASSLDSEESVQLLHGSKAEETHVAERESQLVEVNEADHIKNVYLTFDVQDEEYAVNVAYVTEIVGLQKISKVPDVPRFIKGVINLRGKVIPVMDMRLRFGLPWREYSDRTPVIVLEWDDVPTGLVVDQVTDVVSMLPENIVSPPRWREAEEQQVTVVKGLGRRDDSVSIILDVSRLLSAQNVRLDLPQEAIDMNDEALST
jgi:purine-binding chemotaxis protein CheW